MLDSIYYRVSDIALPSPRPSLRLLAFPPLFPIVFGVGGAALVHYHWPGYG